MVGYFIDSSALVKRYVRIRSAEPSLPGVVAWPPDRI